MSEINPEDAVKEWFVESRRVFDQGKYEEAIPLFEKTIKLCTADKQKSTGFNLIGICYVRLDNLDEALVYFNTALKMNSKNAHALVNRGLLYHDRNNLDEALRDYDAALEIKPNLAEAHATKGTTLLTLGENPEAALVCFKKASALAPLNSEFVGNIGQTHLILGNFEKALKYFVKEIRLDKHSAKGWVHAAQCYHVKNDFRRVFLAIDRALKNDALCAHAFDVRGNVLRDLHYYSIAVIDYVSALRLSKNPQLVEKIEDAAIVSKVFKSCVADCREVSDGKITIDELVVRLDAAVSVAQQKYGFKL
ncbi:tetratricopeptide repeat protein [Candidatus Woesearchaeota archaeon]|nr:tetratricopeptide repeat protein [Candidatus Woesearchaeota archaeon]